MLAMADLDDVRRLALALPETTEGTSYGRLAWKVKGKAFLWERPLTRADREALGTATPDGVVLGVSVADVGVKEVLVAAEPELCFTTPHFDGYPAVLVKLDAAGPADLEELVTEAWLARAPRRLAQAFLAQR